MMISAEFRTEAQPIMDAMLEFANRKYLSKSKLSKLLVSESEQLSKQYIWGLCNNTAPLYIDIRKVNEIQRILDKYEDIEWKRPTSEIRAMTDHLRKHYGVSVCDLSRMMGRRATWLGNLLTSKEVLEVEVYDSIVEQLIKFEDEKEVSDDRG